MYTFLAIVTIIIYVIFVIVTATSETIEDVEFHDGGFLGMGYTTCGHRDLTPADVRKGLMWPLYLILFFIKFIVMMANDALNFFLLVFGYHYSDTSLYKRINTWSLY